MFWLKLAALSLRNRRLTAGLTVLSIALSVALVLSVDRLRSDTKTSFTSTLSGTDLIVGARTSGLNLLLYSVFRLGDPSNNISWPSYQALDGHPAVDWSVPLSLGDSHRGYRVLGTTTDYFKHYQYGRNNALKLTAGRVFERPIEVVLGAEVADKLNYTLGDTLTLSHGIGSVSFANHDQLSFTVVGILKRTATPVDRTLHVPLTGLELVHRPTEQALAYQQNPEQFDIDLTPSSITAFLIGMKSRVHTFAFQRFVNTYEPEPIMAIIPGSSLQTLWRVLSVVENILWVICALVLITGLLGMLGVILASLNERRREMALFRALGLAPSKVYWLLCGESLLYGVLGSALGLMIHALGILLLGPWVESEYGIVLSLGAVFSWPVFYLVGGICLITFILGLLPATQAYRHTLSDGLTIRT